MQKNKLLSSWVWNSGFWVGGSVSTGLAPMSESQLSAGCGLRGLGSPPHFTLLPGRLAEASSPGECR